MPDPSTEQTRKRQFDEQAKDSPPPVRMNRGRIYTLIACSAILAALLLVVVMNIDTGPEPVRTTFDLDDVTELIPPRLTEDELSNSGFDRDQFATPELSEGAMIDVANDDGSLAQQYRFSRLNPRPEGLPPGWLEMVEPFAVIYGTKGQIVTLTGDVAQVRAPNRTLESGTITGNVVIKVFEGEPGRRFVAGELEPTMIVRTEEAAFDNVIGEILCKGQVDITSSTIDLFGTGLSMQINDQQNIIQHLSITHIRYILIHDTQQDNPQASPVLASADSVTTDASSPMQHPVAASEPTPDAASGIADPIPAKSSDETQFYRLTLSDRVRIVQNDPVTGRLGEGDELTIVFSFNSEGIDDMFALGAPRERSFIPPGRTRGPMTREAWLLSLAIASMQDDGLPSVKEGETLITCDGSLTMIPLPDPADRPASPKHSRVTMTGTPVLMRNLGAETEARCGSFIYTTENRRLQMTRSAEHPVQFEAPDFSAQGEYLWLDQSQGIGRFEGPGWLASHSRPEKPEHERQDPDAAEAPRPVPPSNPLERLRVTWQGGVNLKFSETGIEDSLGPLRWARFEEEVRVRGEQGAIECQSLDLTFTLNEQAETVPETMTATGNAKLRSIEALKPGDSQQGQQTIWADLVHVTFIEIDRAARVNETAESANPFGGDTQVETLHAEGDVQILLADGTRVFADTLDGNAQQEEVILLGENLVFVSGPILIERGNKIHLVKSEGTAHWPGPGMARIFTRPIDVNADRRIDRPDLANDDPDNPRQVRSTWTESMRYEGNFNDGAGRLLLAGDVDARSTPSTLESTTMTGDEIELQFAIVESQEPSVPDPQTPDASSRKLGKLIARGDARIESRRHYAEHPEIKPQVFFIAADKSIEYDARTFEALVEGPGELLVRDLLAEGVKSTSRTMPFSGKGTSQFTWNERLEMNRIVDDYYEITMTGDVTGMHLDLDDQTAVITGDRLVTGVTRGKVVEQKDDQEGALVLGSSLQFQQVRGSGGIFIRTSTRDIACHEFVYNLVTGQARMNAAPGGRVTIKTRGEPLPVTAESIDWNLVTDRIEVRRGAGSTGR